ncbi:MAG TPA: KH domain-containing protein [Patescibacteria group bacterium]|nr:KH domain-containing protein [Patescibacteria group bacterium]
MDTNTITSPALLFVKNIITKIVNYPENITFHESDEEYTAVITIIPHQDDFGKVIGKRGKTINAIRTLLSVFSYKTRTPEVESSYGKKIILKVGEE